MTDEDITRKMEFVDYVEIIDTSDDPDPLACAIGNDVWDIIVELAEREHRRLIQTSPAYRRYHARNVVAFHLSLKRD